MVHRTKEKMIGVCRRVFPFKRNIIKRVTIHYSTQIILPKSVYSLIYTKFDDKQKFDMCMGWNVTTSCLETKCVFCSLEGTVKLAVLIWLPPFIILMTSITNDSEQILYNTYNNK